ncbi:hypothetical protein [Undibacterium rugosum]|nr:hypothetical protein [Undibacterium rugosum]MBR7779315.1 hypothetical protein [Undibacterium rugosum]
MMSSMLSGRRWMLICLAGVIAGVLWYWQDEPEPTSPAQAKNLLSSQGRFGPGEWKSSNAGRGMYVDALVPRGLETTPDQHLVINQALHEIMDYFLLSGRDGNRDVHAKALLLYFQEKLPSPAYQDALSVLQHYLGYMDAHDQLLTGQTFPARASELNERDVQRLLTWLEQRERLRQSLLGVQVTQVWYEEDDAQLKLTLNYLRNAAISGGHARFARGMQDALANVGKSFQSVIQEARKKTDGH